MSVVCDQTISKRISLLTKIYSTIPDTKCVKTECGDWCCTKLDESKDTDGNFMSLPLIYTIEYYAILRFIEKNFSRNEAERLCNPDVKTQKCVFRRSGENAGCMIYPVRPFSCRVYGRTVPDIFWGLEYPSGAAKIIDCADCIPENGDREAEFIKRYSGIWDDLRDMSFGLPVVADDCAEIFKGLSGNNEILILGWYERNELLRQKLPWFKNGFVDWWNIFKNLL